MQKKITSLLICAVMLVVSAPAKALAQTNAQLAPAGSGQGARDAQPKPKRDLKTAIAEVTVKGRVDTITEADIKRLERERLNPQNSSSSGFTRKEKIILSSIVAGLLVLAVVLAVKTGKGGHTFCETDPTDPDCLLP